MSFSIRPDHRFLICCPVTYHTGLREGRGIAEKASNHRWFSACERAGVHDLHYHDMRQYRVELAH